MATSWKRRPDAKPNAAEPRRAAAAVILLSERIIGRTLEKKAEAGNGVSACSVARNPGQPHGVSQSVAHSSIFAWRRMEWCKMELKEITNIPSYPDAYWAAGDEVFQLMDPLDRKRTLRLRANLNHNLLLHRRLFLADTSILVSPSMFALLHDEELGPGYQQLFRDGVIVTAMRAAANNYSEVAELIIEKRNFVAEMEEDQIRESARLLDSLSPEIVRTDTRDEMRRVGDGYVLRPEYWVELGLPEHVAVAMTDSVSKKIRIRKLDAVRQSEFWEYARDYLRTPGEARSAQQIRAYMSIASLGTMAKGIGIPPIYPAAYGRNVDRIYGTRTPWEDCGDGRMALLPPFEQKEPRCLERERDIHEIAALLTADQVSKIRKRDEYRKFLQKAQQADQEPGYPAAEILEKALEEFRGYLEVGAGEFLTDWEGGGNKMLLWETKPGQFMRQLGSGAVGTVVAVPGVGPALGAALTLFGWRKIEEMENRRADFRQVTRDEVRDPTVIPELRTRGRIELSLFGAIPYAFMDPQENANS
ncbi:hypothetical protein ACFYWX_02605 [Streptomyces sp. NPDC002888]|jgi:hypothetical protein|uniref:hypothetical protein n=1 Tax=Streptomyces sp. NPDC002888 TaxID=3364668 RepID=UPI0036CCCAC7